jgi:hypothetical protein
MRIGSLTLAVALLAGPAFADNAVATANTAAEATALQAYASALYVARELGYGRWLKSLIPAGSDSSVRPGTRGWYLATTPEKELDEAVARAFVKMASASELGQAEALLRTAGGKIIAKDYRSIAHDFGSDLLAFAETLPADQRPGVQALAKSAGWRVITRLDGDPRFASLVIG